MIVIQTARTIHVKTQKIFLNEKNNLTITNWEEETKISLEIILFPAAGAPIYLQIPGRAPICSRKPPESRDKNENPPIKVWSNNSQLFSMKMCALENLAIDILPGRMKEVG